MNSGRLRCRLLFLLLLPVCLIPSLRAAENDDRFTPEKQYLLWDNKPAALDLKGWEFDSYPLGNAYFGVSFFGGVGEELWQFCEKSLFVIDPSKPEKAYDRASLSSLCEVRLSQAQDFARVSGYKRQVDLGKATGSVRYTLGGVDFLRESIASYPDKCFATRLTASKPGQLTFRLKVLHAYPGPTRTGTSSVEGDTVLLRGEAQPYGLKYEIRVAVKVTGGHVQAQTAGADGEFVVEGADAAEFYVTLATNYRLDPKVFLTQDNAKKLEGIEVPSSEVAKSLNDARNAGFEKLRSRHEADFGRLFGRTQIDLGGKESGIPTGELLASTNLAAPAARYLEELYFQFGRYLLISSSRPGTLPANLQGTWNMKPGAPWTGGYWANINIQMNYWPAFSTGLEETFPPYLDFFNATFPKQQSIAASTLAGWKCPPVEGAWTAGTGNDPYKCSGPGSTSGAGTGPFVILPLWEWYQYTGNREVLEKAWPFMLASSKFLVSALKQQPDGTLLCDPSWSPENKSPGTNGTHINMPGTAYDQELIHENHRITLEAAKILGKTDPILPVLEEQLPKLSPVLIGSSGQIKEFRQENAYGEFGDPHHRHISHLIGLFPGTLLTEKKEWLDAARVSLDLRGDKSTGWAMAHRLNAWTRLKDGQRCYTLLLNLLHKGTTPNLWDTHPPFQIDGNLGGTAGIANMLLQSHEGFIDLLPALPPEWATGSFSGIRARGAFSVSAEWSEMKIRKVMVVSEGGTTCRLRMAGVGAWTVKTSDGKAVPATIDPVKGVLEFRMDRSQACLLTPIR
jgi:alpha-L-fucosidase 2